MSTKIQTFLKLSSFDPDCKWPVILLVIGNKYIYNYIKIWRKVTVKHWALTSFDQARSANLRLQRTLRF